MLKEGTVPPPGDGFEGAISDMKSYLAEEFPEVNFAILATRPHAVSESEESALEDYYFVTNVVEPSVAIHLLTVALGSIGQQLAPEPQIITRPN